MSGFYFVRFCSVTGNITACLDGYSVPCAASQNLDASFRASLNDLCQGNAVGTNAIRFVLMV